MNEKMDFKSLVRPLTLSEVVAHKSSMFRTVQGIGKKKKLLIV